MNNLYDDLLYQINHYQKFPAMMPFIGEKYGNSPLKKILLVGESHYLPEKSVISKNAKIWYDCAQSQLTKEEIHWIHTREILNSNWKSRGHMIFRELEKRMIQNLEKSNNRAMDNVAFMNGFQRSSPNTGDSIKNYCTELDLKIGAETIAQVIDILHPEFILFISKLCWETLKDRIPPTNKTIKFNFVCHSGTGGKYWHNKKYKHGVKKFSQIIKENKKDIEISW